MHCDALVWVHLQQPAQQVCTLWSQPLKSTHDASDVSVKKASSKASVICSRLKAALAIGKQASYAAVLLVSSSCRISTQMQFFHIRTAEC